jgi:hypothetical protein
MRVPQPDIIEHFGNADAVPQLPERCLSRKAGIVRCCPKAKKQTINHENTQDIKQQKAPPRNNPGGARSRVKINNEKIESG